MEKDRGGFLKAEWRKLAMANYAIDKTILDGYLPTGTEIDVWDNTCYVSLVGFMFLNTRLMGIKVPFHSDFEEVNLRFYVRYKDEGKWKRGVVFMKEIVPKPALTLVANVVYGEHYQTLPMDHRWENHSNELTVEYRWKKENWNSIKIVTDATPTNIVGGSEEEFITEHFWGYTRLNAQATSEYGVEHPRWLVYPTKSYSIDVDFEAVYGSDFGFLKNREPQSVFLAEGSEIVVRRGRRL